MAGEEGSAGAAAGSVDGDPQARRVVLEPHGAAVHARDGRGERQTEAGTGARARALQPHEAIEARGHGRRRRMPGPWSATSIVDRLAVARATTATSLLLVASDAFRLAGAVFQRVVDQIGDGLADQFAVADDRQAACGLDRRVRRPSSSASGS